MDGARDIDQVDEVRADDDVAQRDEVVVLQILHLHNAPRVLSATYRLCKKKIYFLFCYLRFCFQSCEMGKYYKRESACQVEKRTVWLAFEKKKRDIIFFILPHLFAISKFKDILVNYLENENERMSGVFFKFFFYRFLKFQYSPESRLSTVGSIGH